VPPRGVHHPARLLVVRAANLQQARFFESSGFRLQAIGRPAEFKTQGR